MYDHALLCRLRPQTAGELSCASNNLGVDTAFVAARKAHPAFLIDGLDELVEILSEAGYPVSEDEPLEGYKRCYVSDPFGNRIELMERLSA